jgi:hypothetical protein
MTSVWRICFINSDTLPSAAAPADDASRGQAQDAEYRCAYDSNRYFGPILRDARFGGEGFVCTLLVCGLVDSLADSFGECQQAIPRSFRAFYDL